MSITEQPAGARDASVDREHTSAPERAMLAELERRYVAVERERARLARIQDFTASLASATSLSDVGTVIVKQGAPTFGAERAAVYVLAGDGQVLEAVHIDGATAAEAEWSAVPLALDVPLARAVNTRAFVADGACAAFPLLAGTRTLGALSLWFGEGAVFSAERRAELDGFARLCSQALDRATLFETAQTERRRAEQANRSKDAFVGMVSHELRTPLNAIVGWVALLRTGRVPEDQRDAALETIHRNARVQSQLIEDLLDITRMSAGKLRLADEDVDLKSVVLTALEAIRPLAEAKRLAIRTCFDGRIGPLRGDPERLQQIAGNLLSNAVKFTPNGGRISIELRASGNDAVLRVEDTGKGIPREFLPFVFERFRQAEEGAARSHGGLGLGLAIVRSLVELHGGSIAASSEGPAQGACFTVTLPLARRTPESTRAIRAAAPVDSRAARAQDRGLRGKKVLVVDDEDDARTLLALLFTSWGMLVFSASSAEEALTLTKDELPDIVVSDIGMPGEDGYSFMERLRRLPPERGGRIPAIALTAYARSEDRARALLAGFTLHATKPVEPSELLEAMARILAKAKAR